MRCRCVSLQPYHECCVDVKIRTSFFILLLSLSFLPDPQGIATFGETTRDHMYELLSPALIPLLALMVTDNMAA
jgi:hypothetical protein